MSIHSLPQAEERAVSVSVECLEASPALILHGSAAGLAHILSVSDNRHARTPTQFSKHFEYFPFTDMEWAARKGYPQAKSKKERSQLGEGAFAITYRVAHMGPLGDHVPAGPAGMEASGVKVKVGKLYAVKSINAKTLHKHGLDILAVEREVEVLAQLFHPHIVRFIKFMSETRHTTDENGEACEVLEHHMIMELAEGGSLAVVIAAKPGPQAAQVVAILNTIPLVSNGIWFQQVVSCLSTAFSVAQFCSTFGGAQRLQTPRPCFKRPNLCSLSKLKPCVMANNRWSG